MANRDFGKIVSAGTAPAATKPDFESIVRSNAEAAVEPPQEDVEFFVRDQPLANVPARLKMSLVQKADKRAELETKRKIFKQIPGFSQGELYLYPPYGDDKPGVLTYKINRDDPSEPEKLVDSPMDENSGFGEFLADTLEFFGGDIGAIFGEGVALKSRMKGLGRLGEKLPGPVGRPIKLFSDVWDAAAPLRLGAGAFAGDIAQSEIERATGLSDISRGRQTTQALGQGALASFGGFVADKLLSPVKGTVTGTGMLRKRRLGGEAQAATERLDIGLLPVNLVASSPIAQKLGGQAGALTTSLREYIDLLELSNNAAFDKFSKLPFKDKTFPPLDYLERVHRSETKRIRQKALDFTKRQATAGRSPSTAEAGEAFQRALADYDLYALSRVNRAYGRARRIAEPQFDLTNLKRKAKEIRRGLRAPQRGETVASPIVMPNGMPARTVQLPGETKRIEVLNNDVRRILDLVDKLDFTQPTQAAKTDILRRLGQELHDAMLPPPGAPMSEVRRSLYNDAQGLFGAVQETIKNVKNTDPKFVEQWHRASKIAQQRFKDNETLFFMQASKNETPTALAARLTNLSDPKVADHWDMIERTVANAHGKEAKKYLEMTRDSLVSELMRDPSTLSQRLASAHPDVLKGVTRGGITRPGMLRPKDLAGLRKAATEFDRLADLGIQNTLKNQSSVGVAINDLARNGHTATIDYLVDVVNRNGGKDGPLGRMVSAGMVRDLYSRSLDLDQGARTNFMKMVRDQTGWQRSGADRLLTNADKQLVEDVALVQNFLRLRSDAGTSLQAAEAVAQMRGGVMQGLRTVAENVGISYLFKNPTGIKVLTGEAAQRKPVGDLLKLSGAVAAQAVGDAEATGALIQQLAGFLAGLPGRGIEALQEATAPQP